MQLLLLSFQSSSTYSMCLKPSNLWSSRCCGISLRLLLLLMMMIKFNNNYAFAFCVSPMLVSSRITIGSNIIRSVVSVENESHDHQHIPTKHKLTSSTTTTTTTTTNDEVTTKDPTPTAASKTRPHNMPFFEHRILHQSKISSARVGQIVTPHGIIDTPGFVPVGTNAALKGVSELDVSKSGLQLMFANTYHLLLHPGTDIIEHAGGLHKFMNRKQPIITDSGGFQVFSLAYGSVHEELKRRTPSKNKTNNNVRNGSVIKISEDGVIFRSYRDGKKFILTPESSVQAQKSFGADIIIPFDELPPYHITKEKLIDSLHRTHRWEERSLIEHLKSPNNQAMYGIIHGGIDKELRKESIDFITKLPFDGYAIGGSMGKSKEEMMDLLQYVMKYLPTNKPNHLLGIADEYSIRNCIPLGFDTFDSCFPTRVGRHGTLLTDYPLRSNDNKHRFSITSSKWSKCYEPIDPTCNCPACTNHTIAYIHHLFKSNEPNGIVLAATHNLYYMGRLMKNLRQSILNDEI